MVSDIIVFAALALAAVGIWFADSAMQAAFKWDAVDATRFHYAMRRVRFWQRVCVVSLVFALVWSVHHT